MYKKNLYNNSKINKEKRMLGKKGMITIEAIIVFPITLIIMLVMFGIISQEYKTAHTIIGLNNMSLEIMTDQGNSGDYNIGEGKIQKLDLFFVDKVTVDIPIRRPAGNLRYIYGEDKLYTGEIFKFRKGRLLVLKSALNNTIFNVEEGRFIDEDK